MGRYSLVNPPCPDPGRTLDWGRLPGASAALAIAQAASAGDRLVVVVATDSRAAQILEDEIGAFASAPPAPFPDWETLPYDQFSPHPDIVSDRISTLYRLRGQRHGVLVLPAQTLLQRLAPRSYLHGSGLVLEPGQRLDTASERRRLEEAGYRCVPQVQDRGEFAVRGSLLDLFPMGAALPYRIELFDDLVETVRTFDPETQLTVEPVDSVNLLPAREFPFDPDAIERFRGAFRNRFDGDLRQCHVYQDAKQGLAASGIEYYLPLFFERTDTLFDYLPEDALLVLETGVAAAARAFWDNLSERYEDRRHDVERPILTPGELYLSPDELEAMLRGYARIGFAREREASARFGLEPPPVVDIHGGRSQHEALDALLGQAAGPVVVALESAGRREVVADQLAALSHRPVSVASIAEALEAEPGLYVTVAPLDDGFHRRDPWLTVLTERQLLGYRAPQGRRARRAGRPPEAIIRDLADLSLGAPVVHEDYGVGRYLGLSRIDTGAVDAEFLAIEYLNGDKLYVPVSSLHLISRYTGASPENAPLHRLGSGQWEKARRRAAEKARDVAAELLDLYARRAAREGRSLSVDDALYHQFASAFPFEETPDQARAIETVIADLAGPRPMDRVVCGDVGFGKTEVALRAAFVAVQAGRQVALLVPTTLLAQQHYRNFLDRFADWPVRIEALSRFRSRGEVQRVLAELADGRLDIVIGTHRLLQSDIRFQKLGLLIVDEEHRFGVRQKEKIKQLRAEVDLLTLTATPIPRTLNMALSGLRDLSIIATAPAHRLAVKTFVGQWHTATIRDAVQRELQRGGQIYFLHNEVKSIKRIARELEALFPHARLKVAHGQMPERELEQVMLDFYRQRFNLLVCTTIIESGIDVPTANTIIINRADKFGLAQLHQLRGRVGRSHHRAYAYLIVPPRKAMTADAAKRLEALAALEDLGVGFTLATHDLEIRGAGELLGDEQSGQITEIGFELYMELLERAVAALKSGRAPDLEGPLDRGCEIDLHLTALIPEDYLPDVHARLVLYKRIASAPDDEALDALKVEMIDRFGLLPEAVKNLFAVASLRIRAAALGIRQLELGASGGKVVFASATEVEPATVIRLIQQHPRRYRMDGEHTLRLKTELEAGEDRVRAARALIEQLKVKDAA